MSRKFSEWAAAKTAGALAGRLARGQAHFARMIWKFNSAYNPCRQLADHARDVRYGLPAPPPRHVEPPDSKQLYIHSRARTARRV